MTLENDMHIKITAMVWVKGGAEARETVELDGDELMEILRGAKKPPFKTPVDNQYHWELREVLFS